jgi:hypothetical protein
MSGRYPAAGEIAYGKALTVAAYEHAAQLRTEADKAAAVAAENDWTVDQTYFAAHEANLQAELAVEHAGNAAMWTWQAEYLPRVLAEINEPEIDEPEA